MEIAREKADLWGYNGEPYDALLESYERRTSTAAVAALRAVTHAATNGI